MTKSTFTVHLILKLDRKEAIWLRSLLQNPCGGEAPEEEDPISRKHREAIFNAIPVSLESDPIVIPISLLS